MAGSCTVLVLDGVADGSVGLTLDVLGAAARIAQAKLPGAHNLREPPSMRLVSLDGRPVTSAGRRTLTVDRALSVSSLGKRDVVVLPGLGMATPEQVEQALARADVQRAMRALRQLRARGVTLAASCSATFVLGAAGVLDGREATTTWWLSPLFAQHFPQVVVRADRMVVESRGVLTSGSAFSHADLMLALLARMAGPSLAHLVARYLVLDERPSQARYMISRHLRTDDPSVRKLERFVLANLARPIALRELARACATSSRTLARRVDAALGTTPLRFAQRLKLEHAVHLLEAGDASVDEIAATIGYQDAGAFRRALRRETGRSPRDFRK